MKIKKIIVTTISVAFVLTLMFNNVQAQKKFVNKALIWAESGEKLDTALKAIEFSETQEKTKEWGKTYYVKGVVYEAIAKTKNPEFQNICDYPLIKAFENFRKAYDMNGVSAYQSAMDLKFYSLSNDFIKMAMNTYKEKDYESSFMYFAKSLEVKEMSIFKGEVDTALIFNTATAAQRIKKYDVAIGYYNRLIEYGYGEGDTHALLASCYKEKGDPENYLEELKKGYEKYPANANLIGGIINYYLLEADNSEGAFEYLNIAKKKNPENAQYYLAEAQLYTKIGQPEKAKELYLETIELSPDLFEAQYNLGVLYFNEAVVLSDEANNITDNVKYQAAKEIADAKFAEALPYIENAHKLSPEDTGIMSTLKTLYYRLKMNEKYEEISKKMQ